MTIAPPPPALAGFRRGAGLDTAGRWASPLALARALDRRYVVTPALRLIDAALVRAEQTPDARLVIVMAPQEGKSQLASRHATTWALTRDPTRRVAITSYADRLARRWGRRVRNDIRENSGRGETLDLQLRLAPDQSAADEWELAGTGGGVYTAGVGGSLTGRPVDWLLIDDPLRGRKDADSPVIREDVWDWWEGTASSRLAPGAPVILILTRWHHDDLAGRLLARQPGEWDVVHIPAQADPAVVHPDPLGRAPGEFMVSARGRTPAQWEKRKRDAGDEWEPLYQGAPAAPGGDVFEVDRIQWWRWGRGNAGEPALACGPTVWSLDQCWRFATIDTATSTSTSADYTVVGAWAVPPDGSLVLLDVARDRVPPHRQLDLARPLVQRWRLHPLYVEPSLKDTTLVREATREGYAVEDVIADRSKVLRAAPAARRVRQGSVWFPADMDPQRTEELLTEMRQFPNGAHDDFVDVLAYAAAARFEEWLPPSMPEHRRRERHVEDRAVDVALPDPMRAEW